MSITYRSSLTFVAAVLTSAVLVSSAAAAAAPSQPVVVTAPRSTELETRLVSYRDLNLGLSQDQRTLHRRVGFAVNDVCGRDDFYAARTVRAFSLYRACSDVAWGGATPQIAAAIGRAMAGLDASGSQVAGSAITVSARAGG